jgi:uncharacterized membrane protein YoaK (UPF0700 family)
LKLGSTARTGTLVSLGEKITDALRSSTAEGRWGWAPYLMLWIGLTLGATTGALSYRPLGAHALFLPTAALVLLAVVSAAALRRTPE